MASWISTNYQQEIVATYRKLLRRSRNTDSSVVILSPHLTCSTLGIYGGEHHYQRYFDWIKQVTWRKSDLNRLQGTYTFLPNRSLLRWHGEVELELSIQGPNRRYREDGSDGELWSTLINGLTHHMKNEQIPSAVRQTELCKITPLRPH